MQEAVDFFRQNDQFARHAGIELITAVSAPTSMAIDVARNCNITLCAFVRETRATIFTHPARIAGMPG